MFIISIVIYIHGHRLEIFTLIHENLDLVFGIKIIFELEGIINSQESCFSFLNRSIPFFPKEQIVLKSKEQKLMKIEATFVDDILGLAKVKILDRKVQNAMMLKFKFLWNLASLDVTNSSLETVIFDPKEMLGILDLRLIGYYKIKQRTLQQNLSNYYRLNQLILYVSSLIIL